MTSSEVEVSRTVMAAPTAIVMHGGKHCVAGGPNGASCKNSNFTEGVSMHKFPQVKNIGTGADKEQEKTRSLWIQFVKRHRRDFEVSATSVLCSAHFEPSCFTQDLEIAGICGIKRKLTSGAVPTIDIAGLPKQTAPATTDWERRRLIRELLQPATQEQTGQNRTQDIRLTVKEEDHQEKNLGHGGTAANHVKKEPLDELEEDLVNCCNKTAQLLGDKCGTAGTDAVVENEQSMDFDNCHNTGTSSQQSCTVGTVEEQQETNPGMSYNQIVDTVEGELEVNSGNCYNTNTPSQLRCSIGPGGIQVKKEGGQEMNFGSCYNTVTVTSQLSSITVVTSQPSSSTFVTSQPGSSPVVTSQPSCSTVVTTQLSSSTVTPQLSSTSSSVVTSQPGSSPVVTSQPSSRTVVTPQLSSSAVLIPQLSSRIVIIPQLSSSTVFIPQLSSSTVFIPQLSSSTVIIPQLSSSTVIPQLSSSTVVTPQLRSSRVVMPQPSSSTVVTPHLSSSTVVTSQLRSSTVVMPQLSSSTVVTSQLRSSTVVMPQPSFSTVVTPQLSSSTVVAPQPSSSTVVTPQLSSSTIGDSVKLESVQKVDLSNCYTTSTSSQLCSDMVGITQKHNSETNIGSSTPDQQSLNTNRSKVEETPRFDSTYPLVQSYCAYWPPGAIKRAMKEAAEIPQACVDPAKSRWHVHSYEMEECVPEQVDYMGTGHAASDNNQDSNYAAVNPGLPKPKQLIRQVLELRKEDSLEMDNGNSNVTDSTSPQLMDELTDGEDNLSDISNITDILKDVLEDGNDSEESDKEVSSSVSENEKKGHKSDSSRHMSSEEEELSGDDSDDSVSSSGSDWLEEIQRQNQLKRKRQRQRNKGKKKTSWVCKCQEKFTGKRSYEEHKREAHPVTCVYCEEKFTSTQALRKHQKTHMSSEDKLDLKGNKLFMCDHCGLFFTSTKLKRHELQISTARPYKCEVENCKATYKTKSAVRCHFITVHNRDRFPCPYEGCKKTYGDKSRMMKHYKVHTNERRYQCSYCGKMFQRGEHLRVHTRIHTGDTPFNCTLCNYSGRQYNSLRSHMKVHHPEHCVKSGDEKGIKPSKKPRKKAVINKDSLADKGPGSAKKTTPYSTRSQFYRAK
ncbi:uncharacterized protein LOC144919756 isoform X1 [Branchiostoma floridae x Branchiostoma belcheri]